VDATWSQRKRTAKELRLEERSRGNIDSKIQEEGWRKMEKNGL